MAGRRTGGACRGRNPRGDGAGGGKPFRSVIVVRGIRGRAGVGRRPEYRASAGPDSIAPSWSDTRWPLGRGPGRSSVLLAGGRSKPHTRPWPRHDRPARSALEVRAFVSIRCASDRQLQFRSTRRQTAVDPAKAHPLKISGPCPSAGAPHPNRPVPGLSTSHRNSKPGKRSRLLDMTDHPPDGDGQTATAAIPKLQVLQRQKGHTYPHCRHGRTRRDRSRLKAQSQGRQLPLTSRSEPTQNMPCLQPACSVKLNAG